MNTNYIKQVLYDMRHQPVIGIVTIAGTAMAIFLIMIVVMINRVDTAPFAPEVNRGRTLYGRYINIENPATGENSSSNMSLKAARTLYDDLDGAECVTFVYERVAVDVTTADKPSTMRYVKYTDHNFWQVYDFDFVAGRPIDQNSFDTAAKDAVICESLARELYGSDDPIGKTILVAQKPYYVVGVVRDVSRLAREAFADVYATYRGAGRETVEWGDNILGPYSAIILAESRDAFDRIRADVASRRRILAGTLDEGFDIVDHGAPFTQEVAYTVTGSNMDPDDSIARRRLIIYAILLLVPAINLSSMTHSRLARRSSEIGVRRAFGATRMSIMRNIVAENMLVTAAGGIIGLIATFVFGYFFSELIFTDYGYDRAIQMPLQLLLDWKIYGMAMLFCFILNLLSSGIPAWRASRTDPVKALSMKV